MYNLIHDVKYGLRLLVRNPGFATVAILTLALGIGANTAIFSVIDHVLLASEPYPEPERLVLVQSTHPDKGNELSASQADIVDWEAQNETFDGLGGVGWWTFNLTGSGEPARILGVRVTGDTLRLMGVEALLGRAIVRSDDVPGGENRVVLSFPLWQSRFGGDPAVLGRSITLNGQPHEVIGVMPPGFEFPDSDIQLWAPVGGALTNTPRDARFFLGVGRLKPGVDLARARTDLAGVAARLAAEYPATNKDWGIEVTGLHDAVVGDVRATLVVVLGVVAFVLLIACANVAHLMLARAADRSREIAVRAALGAGRRRIATQLLVECLMLGVIGGALGLVLATWAVDALRGLAPQGIPRLETVAIDLRVLVFTAGLSIVTALLFGLLPALRLARPDLQRSLKEGARTTDASAGRSHSMLAVAEIALALVVVVGGGLLVKSFSRLMSVDPGFDPDRLITVTMFLTGPRYPNIEAHQRFYDDVLERVAALPGVESAAAISHPPVGGGSSRTNIRIEGRDTEPGDEPWVSFRMASPGYFHTMRIPLLTGRTLRPTDVADAPLVALINRRAAERYWPGEDPLGRRVRFSGPLGEFWHEVVGVVEDVKSFGLDQEDQPAAYVSFRQNSFPWLRWNTLAVRAAGEPTLLAAPIKAAIHAADANLPVYDVATMEDRLAASLDQRRFAVWLVSTFAGVAFVLAVVGVYGVIGYSVSRRRHEFGVRMALGARPADILGLVLRRGTRLAVIGTVLGLIGATALSRYLSTLLFEIRTTDPATWVTASMVLILTATLAAWVPARRAMHVDPVRSLRDE